MQITGLEAARAGMQAEIDSKKTTVQRNLMGQFATPNGLAVEMMRHALKLMGKNKDVRFIDPAFGTGSFYSALLSEFPSHALKAAVGYEVDNSYGVPALELWDDSGLDLHISDFTRERPPPEQARFNLLVCNPPYVRHHHIPAGEKTRLGALASSRCGTRISALAGMYCYFLCLSHEWMSPGGLAGWLVPSEFMDVNYGDGIKNYLLERVTLLHVHRFDPRDVQFGDALVSSAILWFANKPPPSDHSVLFTYGGTLSAPSISDTIRARVLRNSRKWTRHPASRVLTKSIGPVLGDFFRIRRGIATGSNGYFMLQREEIKRRGLPMESFIPVVPPPRQLRTNVVNADNGGNPALEPQLFLLYCKTKEDEIAQSSPELHEYLAAGRASGVSDRYLCRNRTPWYSQESRQPAPILCTYMGRGDRPFRFILNESKAIATNSYLMLYPIGQMAEAMASPGTGRRVWEALNSLRTDYMISEGRVYGGGLHKIEPAELARVNAAGLTCILEDLT